MQENTSNAQEIKLVLTDMDGTIVLPGKHEVSERVRQAVIDCEDLGITVAAVTGRPFEFAQAALQVLGFDDMCVFDGGATVRHVVTGEIVWSKWLEAEKILRALTVLLPYANYPVVYESPFVDRRPEDVDLDNITGAVPFVFAAVLNEDVADVEARLAEIAGVVAHTNPDFEGNKTMTGIQVTHEQADKYHGVAALLAEKGLSPESILAIGDSNNDLPLFKSASLKIAMGNATEKLKAEADYVVASVEDDGFAEAMERFVLSK